MNRRSWLRTLALGAAGSGLAGCNAVDSAGTPAGTETATPTEEAPTPTAAPGAVPTATTLDRWSFDLEAVAATGIRAEDDPEITFMPGSNSVTVAGTITVGSSKCKRADLESVRYWEPTLEVTVTSISTIPPGDTPACTDDVSSDRYEVTVEFEEGLPDRVVVIEEHSNSDSQRTEQNR